MRRGALFAALRGEKEDGGRFLADAARNGAVCALCESPPDELPPDELPPDKTLPYVLVPDARFALARMAAVWYGNPAGKMKMVGVTGTNGKTTTTYLIKQLLEKTVDAKVGLIGTNQNMIGGEALPAERTTPDSLMLQSLLARMANAGCTHAVMEVSSHALAQHRTAGIVFDAAVFTNLTQDHLDYHGTMEAYCGAKARLFRQCRAAAVNGDSAWAERVLSGADCPVLRYGQTLANDLVGWHQRYESERVRFTACDEDDCIETFVPIPGDFSLYNALAALAAARLLGVPLKDAAGALQGCHGVRGRCEVVPTSPTFAPAVFSKSCLMRYVVVVFPFVPVTPTTFIFPAGFPYHTAAMRASAKRASGTRT